jgi:dimethylaniline monooxygenase (N-oxide forming)
MSMAVSNEQAQESVLHEPIGIIGAGVSGLISAQVLLKDGFTNVTLISRDKSVGGTWARERVYPGLFINKYAFFGRLQTSSHQ